MSIYICTCLSIFPPLVFSPQRTLIPGQYPFSFWNSVDKTAAISDHDWKRRARQQPSSMAIFWSLAYLWLSQKYTHSSFQHMSFFYWCPTKTTWNFGHYLPLTDESCSYTQQNHTGREGMALRLVPVASTFYKLPWRFGHPQPCHWSCQVQTDKDRHEECQVGTVHRTRQTPEA